MAEKTPMSAQIVASVSGKGRDTKKLIERAKTGDASCLPEIRALLADDKEFREDLGSPVEWLWQTFMKKLAGKHLLIQEAAKQKLDELRSELEGPNPTPIERLLAQRACLCWFIVHWHETAYFGNDGMTLQQADYYQRRIDRAHARFLSAVRTLAQIRKLALPTLQVNIARNQVNVAQSSPPGRSDREAGQLVDSSAAAIASTNPDALPAAGTSTRAVGFSTSAAWSKAWSVEGMVIASNPRAFPAGASTSTSSRLSRGWSLAGGSAAAIASTNPGALRRAPRPGHGREANMVY